MCLRLFQTVSLGSSVNRGNREVTLLLFTKLSLNLCLYCLETRQPTSFGPSWSPEGFSIRKCMSGA
jgi:hypothetical protein